MIEKHTVWLSPQAHEHLQHELATLRRLTTSTNGDEDTDENAAAVQAARRSRIQQIHDLLMNAVVGEDPPNDGIAEPGMVVTVRYDDTGETDTFLLGVRGAEYGELDVYSVQSPLGAAIAGARPGHQCSYTTPNGKTMIVTMLRAVPHGIHTLTG
ncbi:GreA/GreB family elongation factor [Mycolicibacterium arseniciresistens]|uniref:GreA/GreB family elongation factor n=1 Tax=Mycolicibacterium arseniciresistens TaxID=3062257 RepID=A0ABT8U959_9MYCO|nr:GreA/GreB family elongation factor [Mycolicibacterium arseniciresistens]MDO3634327.1 GreA/GreB family elongation factor [Mycolicibacterium arseniciresistens]